jgi:hypothetical protein
VALASLTSGKRHCVILQERNTVRNAEFCELELDAKALIELVEEDMRAKIIEES